MLAALIIFAVLYRLAFSSRDPEAGIWKVLAPDRVLYRDLKDQPVKLTAQSFFRPLAARKGEKFPAEVVPQGRALRQAFYFSLLSAFSLGWRELNVGAWITRLQRREYTLRATGWVRTVAGLQSLMSVYLLALWALTYFGRPFE